MVVWNGQTETNVYAFLEPPVEFTKPLEDQTVEEEATAVLECEVSRENAKVKWFKNGEEIHKTKKYDIIAEGRVRKLIIHGCTLDDAKTYTCDAKDFKTSCFLNVEQEDLRIIEPLEDIETVEKKTVTFWCKVNRLNVTLKWTKNGEEVTFDKRILYKVDKYKHSLIIKNCGFIDEGEYTVTAGQDKSVAELIIAEAPADFIEHLQDQTVTEFDDAVFTCQLSKEKASVKWYRNGREIREGKKYQFEKDGNLHRLIIKDCRLDDECEYSCGVDDRKSRARLFVEGMYKFRQYLLPVLNAYEAPGTDVIFMAELNKDGVEVKWLRNNMIIVQGDKHQMMSEGKLHRLQVCEIRPRDQGEYRFIHPGSLGFPSTLQLKLSPLPPPPPRFIVPEPLKIRVPITGYPVPTATWSFGDKILEKGDRVKIQTTAAFAELVITPSERPDKGIYTLKLENPVSSVSGEINVNVIDKPGPPAAFDISEITNESCVLTWNPPRDDGGSKITNYVLERRAADSEIWHKLSSTIKETNFRKQEYSFRVRAVNKAGESEPSEPSDPVLFPPSPPRWLEVINITKNTADLKWTAPERDGGSPITNYIVEKRDVRRKGWQTVDTTSIVPDKEYVLRVRAVNAVGASEPSDISENVVAKDPDCNPTVDLKTRDIIVVKGEKLSIPVPYRAVPSPTITWHKDGGEYLEIRNPVIAEDPKRKIIFQYIIDSIYFKRFLYIFHLFICFCYDSTERPDPPVDLEVHNPTSKSATLTWKPPLYDGGSKIMGYIIEKLAKGEDKWERCNDYLVPLLTYTVKGLEEGKEYQFRARAENAAGISQTEHFSPIKIMHYSNFSAEPPNVELDVSVKNGIQILAGKTLRIPATVTGRPTPTIVWTLEEGTLEKDRVVIENIGTKSELIIQNALRKDHGRYVITATNESMETYNKRRIPV
uniref:Titin n=1 Tax=Crocodylus porosus TaxID=8502 RepID=A0A7M4F6M8_CROPO